MTKAGLPVGGVVEGQGKWVRVPVGLQVCYPFSTNLPRVLLTGPSKKENATKRVK